MLSKTHGLRWLIRSMLTALALAALSSQTFAAGLMGSDTALFSTFEKLCRMPSLRDAPKCLEAVEKVMQSKCDMRAFWTELERQGPSRVRAVLPWPYGVADIAKKPGICASK